MTQTKTLRIVAGTVVVLLLLGVVMAGAVSADESSAVDDGSTAITDEEWKIVNNVKELKGAVAAGGNVRIGKTISMGGQLDIKNKVVLDLNGCELRFRHKWHIYVAPGGDLTIMDSKTNGKIMGGKSKGNGGCIYVDHDASLTLKSGTIRDGNCKHYGAGVYVNSNSTFIMEGGTITNCTAHITEGGQGGCFGGGVAVNENAKFIMKGGTIYKNKVSNPQTCQGGGVYVNGGTFEMSGGSISENKLANSFSGDGYGVYMNGGTFTMSGDSTISKNESPDGTYYRNFGIHLTNNATFTMSGNSKISQNDGGGISIEKKSIFEMKGGIISENGNPTSEDSSVLTYNGGGVYIIDSTFIMEKGIISQNRATASGGGVYLESGKFNMKGGIISENVCDLNDGGGVYLENGTFNIEGGTISKNKISRGYNGGVFVKNGIINISGSTNITGNLKGSKTIDDNLGVWDKGKVNLADNFTGEIRVSYPIPAEGKEFGTASAKATGAEHFLSDDGKLWGANVGGKLVWQKASETCTVTFDVQGHGTAPADQHVKKGGKVAKPTDPTASGYIFGGWYKEAACKTVWNFATDVVNSNTTLYAKWSPKQTYTVTFDLNGQAGTPPASQKVLHGGKVIKPADPTAKGYKFGGWFTESSCTHEWNFETDVVTSNLKLYAKWMEPELFKVTFDVQGHGTAPAPQYVERGKTVDKPTMPEKEGHFTFGGWYKEAGCINPWNFTTDTVKGPTTIYAKWIEDTKYKVIFDVQGHGLPPATQLVYKGECAERPADPAAKGYIFDDWYTGTSLETKFDFNTKITGNTTVYAKWIQDTGLVVFNNMGHGETPEPQAVEIGGKVKNPGTLSEPGYTFGGWFKNIGCTDEWNFATDKVEKSLTTLYAKWTPVATYTVTFENEHGTAPAPQLVIDGGKVTKPADPEEVPGYTFKGWYKGDTEWNFDTEVHENMTLKAKWTENPTVSVIFNSNGGSSVQSQPVKIGEKVSKPADPTKFGETFEGWYLDNGTFEDRWDFEKDVVEEEYVSEGKMTLYAHWVQSGHSISVKVDKEGAGYVFASRTKAAEGKEIWIYAEPYTGYEFVNFTSTDVKVTTYPDTGIGMFTMPNKDVTVTANFKDAAYLVTCYSTGGGTLTSSHETASKDEKVTFTAKPDAGYTVQGNKIQITNKATGKVTDYPLVSGSYTLTMPASDIGAEVTFVPNECIITVSSSEGGSIAADKTKAHTGDRVTIYLVPDDGYKFDSLKINDTPVEVSQYGRYYYYQFTVDGSVVEYKAVATFSKSTTEYDIEVTEPEHGSLGTDVSKAGVGDTVTVYAVPDSGYTVLDGNVKIIGKDSGTETSVSMKKISNYWEGSFVMPDEAVTVSADFTRTPTVTFDPDGGTVSPGSKVVTVGKAYGDLPTPKKSGYAFQGWYYTDSSSSEHLITKDTIVGNSEIEGTKDDHDLKAKWTEGSLVISNLGVDFGTDYVGSTKTSPIIDYIYNYTGETVSVDEPTQQTDFTFKVTTPSSTQTNVIITPNPNLSVGTHYTTFTVKLGEYTIAEIPVTYLVLDSSEIPEETTSIPSLPTVYTTVVKNGEGDYTSYVGVKDGKFTIDDNIATISNEFVDSNDYAEMRITNVKKYESEKIEGIELSSDSAVSVNYPSSELEGGTNYTARLELNEVSTFLPSLSGEYKYEAALLLPSGYKAISMISPINGKETLKAIDKNISYMVFTFTVPKNAVTDPDYLRAFQIKGDTVDEAISTWCLEDDGYHVYVVGYDFYPEESETSDLSSYVIAEYKDEPEPTPSHSGGSTAATFTGGTKNGDTFTFDNAVVVKEATLPGATSAKIVKKSGSGWYNFELTAPGFTGNGSMKFEVPLDVLEVKGYTTGDVGLYHKENGEWMLKPTVLLSTDSNTAYYKATFDSCSPFTIDFEKDATTNESGSVAEKVTGAKETVTEKVTEVQEKAEEVKTSSKTTTETKTDQTTTKSPVPVLGILAGLGAAVMVMRRK